MDQHNSPSSRPFYEQVHTVTDLRQLFSNNPHEEFTKISINFADHVDFNGSSNLDQYLPAFP